MVAGTEQSGGNQNVQLSAETQGIESQDMHVEQRGLWQYLWGQKRLIQDIDLIQQKGMESGWDMEMKEKEKDLLLQLDARETQEEIFWKQKSRVKWIHKGEKNTKFFHNSVVYNRLRSKIHKIKKLDGS